MYATRINQDPATNRIVLSASSIPVKCMTYGTSIKQDRITNRIFLTGNPGCIEKQGDWTGYDLRFNLSTTYTGIITWWVKKNKSLSEEDDPWIEHTTVLDNENVIECNLNWENFEFIDIDLCTNDPVTHQYSICLPSNLTTTQYEYKSTVCTGTWRGKNIRFVFATPYTGLFRYKTRETSGVGVWSESSISLTGASYYDLALNYSTGTAPPACVPLVHDYCLTIQDAPCPTIKSNCLSGLTILIQYCKTTCGGGHVCNRAIFDLWLGATTYLGQVNMNNGGGSEDPQLDTDVGGNRGPFGFTITEEQAATVFAENNEQNVSLRFECALEGGCHVGVGWVYIFNTDGCCVYSACPVGTFSFNPCNITPDRWIPCPEGTTTTDTSTTTPTSTTTGTSTTTPTSTTTGTSTSTSSSTSSSSTTTGTSSSTTTGTSSTTTPEPPEDDCDGFDTLQWAGFALDFSLSINGRYRLWIYDIIGVTETEHIYIGEIDSLTTDVHSLVADINSFNQWEGLLDEDCDQRHFLEVCYIPCTITVNCEPHDYILNYARWQVDGGADMQSGEKSPALTCGEHTITYSGGGYTWYPPVTEVINIQSQIEITRTWTSNPQTTSTFTSSSTTIEP